MPNPELVVVAREGDVATVTVNRPDKLNALNSQTIAELTWAFQRLAGEGGADETPVPPRVAILTGAGEKAFVAGADIAEMSSMTTLQAKRFADAGHRLCSLIETVPFPVIAAVNGFALGGGCELALACDFAYASERAKLGQPEISLGVIPGFGGTQRLARRVGVARARELIYTGEMIDAAQALAMGLVNSVVPGESLLSRVQEVAQRIAAKGPVALAQAKRTILRGVMGDLTVATELEAQAFSMLFGTADQREGMTAFLGKRKPEFSGK